MAESTTKEYGYTGLIYSRSRYGSEEFLPALRGRSGVRIYREMSLNDPVIGGILHATKQKLRQVVWNVYTPLRTNVAQEARAFIASCMNDMSVPWSAVQTEIYTMLVYGWAVLEKVYKVRKGDSLDKRYQSKHSDGKYGIRKLSLRAQSTLQSWELDKEGGIQTFVQVGMSGAKNIPIPIEKLLLYRTTVENNNPEGLSAFRNAYHPWYCKKNLEEILLISAERDLVGLPYFKPPVTFNAKDPAAAILLSNVEHIIRNVRNDEQAGIIGIPGWEFSLISSPGDKQFDLLALLNYYDKRIAMTVLGQFIMLGLERVGSFALSETQGNLFDISLRGWLLSVAEVTNRFLVDELLRMNGYRPEEVQVSFIPGPIDAPNMLDVSKYVLDLFRSNAIDVDAELKQYLRTIGGLDVVQQSSAQVREAGGSTHFIDRSGAGALYAIGMQGVSSLSALDTEEGLEKVDTPSVYLVDNRQGDILFSRSSIEEVMGEYRKRQNQYADRTLDILLASESLDGALVGRKVLTLQPYSADSGMFDSAYYKSLVQNISGI